MSRSRRFDFDPEAIADAHESEHEHYVPPDLSRLSDVVMGYPGNEMRLIQDPALKRTYMDALLDLHVLVEEYRFEALLALSMLRDYVIKRDRGEAAVVEEVTDENGRVRPWPAEAIVVLRGYARPPPNAATLFDDPHRQIAGGRILSRWFAAQLIDSALYRGIAACDRLAILLRCQAGEPIAVTQKGERRQPAFRRADLKLLERSYAAIPQWPTLVELTVNPLYDYIKQQRNGFTHEGRAPAELHGGPPLVYGTQDEGAGEVVAPMDAATHYALAPAFYNVVLRPAVELTATIVATAAA